VPEIGSYTIHIDGRWSLEDLYVFARTFEQVYFAVEAILPATDEETNERIVRAFQIFPWQGGYSAVGFYNQLKLATPAKRRPVIASIRYSSPGWLELLALLSVTTTVTIIVNRIAKTLEQCNHTYNQIYTDALHRKLLKMEVERRRIDLTKEQADFLIRSSDTIAQMMGIPSAEIVDSRTSDPFISMKIFLSLYRRVRTLATYQKQGKADFSDEKSGGDA
jgi:hypothetical protein